MNYQLPTEAVLFGGGLDSCALVEFLIVEGFRPLLVHIDYGQKARRGEVAALCAMQNRHSLESYRINLQGVLPDSPLTTKLVTTDHDKNFIPFRNLLFMVAAAAGLAHLPIEKVYLGFHQEPGDSVYHDAKANVILPALNTILHMIYPNQNISFHAPFGMIERVAYLRSTLNLYPSLFEDSFSCYESITEIECGRCTHCQQKSALRRSIG